jgi:hypothetical protein
MSIATGQDILAADINNLFKIVRKTADETVNNSDVFQDDNHLLLALGANEVWYIDAFLLTSSASSGTPDLKYNATVPAGATIYTRSIATNATGTLAEIESGSGGTFLGDTNVRFKSIHFVVINGANAGNFQLQWAQNTATAEDTKILTNSVLFGHKVA